MKNRQLKASAEEGNTVTSSGTSKSKQDSRHTYYAITVHNYSEIELAVKNRLVDICKKFVYGREICPTTGNKHLQGFLSLKKPMRGTELKIPGNPHYEACIASAESNEEYCKKDGDYITHGYPKPIEIISELYPWQKNIETIFLQKPDKRKIYWFWEETGNIGKTEFVKYMVIKHKALFCSGGKHADLMNLVFNQNMDECTGVLFDIPRAHRGHISYTALESIKNGMVCNTKYETGVKIFNSPHIFVFANYPPEDPDMLSADRWVITEL